MIDETPAPRQPVRAVSGLLETLPRLASSILGITAVAYVIGWRLSSVYYTGLGAPWVAHLLTVQQMSASASWFVFAILGATVFATVGVISGQATALGLVRWSSILFGVGMVLYTLFNDTFGVITWRYGPVCESLGGMSFAISIGLSLGELVALAADGRSLTTYLPHWVGPLLVAALFQGPQAFAGGVAKIDGSVPSRLPIVTLVTPDGHQWRMVGPAGDQLLLISPNNDVHARIFRLVAPSMIAAVGAPPIAEARAPGIPEGSNEPAKSQP